MNNVRFNRVIRALQLMLVLTLLLSVCLIVSACKCEHEYKSEVTRKPTCVSTGEMTYTCEKCGDVYTEEISVSDEHALSEKYIVDGEFHYQVCENCNYTTEKAAHSYASIVSSEPSTCTKHGCEVKSCVCGETRTEELPLAEHEFTAYKNNGDTHCLKCKNCDATNGAELPHEFTTEVFSEPSTCTKQGSVIKSCVCGASVTEILPLAQHTFTKILFTCDEHWTVCAVCNAEDPNHPKTSHNLTTVTIAAECEKAGKTVTSCSDCDYERTVVLPALEHDLDKTGFSSSPTNSGHYYKCNRCGKDVAVPHTLVDCDCPDGHNHAATCYEQGHQDQQCTVCSWHNHFPTPMTDNHTWSDDWTSNGTFHWHVCLNGEGACTAKGNETQHSWITKRVEPKCEENGREWRECSVCGHVQSGSNKIINATGHDNVFVRIITAATCTENGEEELRCNTCGTVSTAVIKAAGHKMTSYNMERTDVNGHYRQCSVCKFTSETPSGHTWTEEVKSEPTCTSDGLTVRTCKFCGFTHNLTTHRDHHYLHDDPTFTDPTKFADPTCTEYGWYMATCEYCGDHQKVVQDNLGYADHTLKYYPAKEMTETEAGNRNYWQCQVCHKYFSSKDCHEVLTADQVFTYPPKVISVPSIAQLLQIAANVPEGEDSYDAYRITATITEVNSETRVLRLTDGTNELYVSVVNKENLSTVNKGMVVTLKGNLYRLEDEVTLVNCEIVSVAHEDGWYSLFISVKHQYDTDAEFTGKVFVYAYDELDMTYYINTKNYNCLLADSELKVFINNLVPDGNVLQKLIINGKAATVTEGEFSVTVTEDVRIEMVFGSTNKCSVRIDKLDTTNNNGNAVIVDEYVSYTYVGQYNDNGRLLANSHLKFTVNNANITGINITYDADYLEQNPEILDNVINAIKQNGVKVSVTQPKPNKNSQVVITLSGSDAYTALDYFTSASQARVSEIIINYETLNNTQSF